MINLFTRVKETGVVGQIKSQATMISITPTTRFERRCYILYESYNRFVEDGERLLAADVLMILKSVLDDEIKTLTTVPGSQ